MAFTQHRAQRRGRPRTWNGGSSEPKPLLIPIAGAVLTLILAFLGGASRNDLWVQPIVQCGAIILIAVMLMRPAPRPAPAGVAPLTWAIAALIVIMAIQLLPLPPALWRALPNREVEAQIADAVGLASIWRPLSVVPDNTLSALLGMTVPAAVLIVFVRTPLRLLDRLMWLVAVIGVGQLLLGLGQLATGEGALFFYPRTTGTVTGLFHNRNHLAIFLGTLPAVFAYIALSQRDKLDRREPLWAGFAIALALAAFGVALTGSRIGLAVWMLATAGAILMIWRTEPRLRARVSRPMSRGTRIAVMIGSGLTCTVLAALVLVRSDTALTRFGATNLSEEGRINALRPLLELIWRFFPFGSGFGTFDRVFRMIEPENQLRLSYLNHAHNDLIEVLIEGGLASAVVAIAVAFVTVRGAIAVWRSRGPFDPAQGLARSGSIVAAGLLLGCVSDYPLRTPMLAGWMTLALCLLLGHHGASASPRSARALPEGLDAKEAVV
jgi:O-antigen ligase